MAWPTSLDVNPIVFTAAGQSYAPTCVVLAIIWEGVTASGDRAELMRDGVPSAQLLWAGRTDTTQTYQGLNMGPTGIQAPHGFHVTALTAGRLLIYLKET